VTDASPSPASTPALIQREPAPFLTRRTLLLLAASLLVTLLFVREFRREMGPCRAQFHALQTNQPRLLRVQDDDENPGGAGLPADPCDSQSTFGFSPERAYAALSLALWAVTIFCVAADISAFRKCRRRRQRRAHRGKDGTPVGGEQVS